MTRRQQPQRKAKTKVSYANSHEENSLDEENLGLPFKLSEVKDPKTRCMIRYMKVEPPSKMYPNPWDKPKAKKTKKIKSPPLGKCPQIDHNPTRKNRSLGLGLSQDQVQVQLMMQGPVGSDSQRDSARSLITVLLTMRTRKRRSSQDAP